ncbi:MAG: hypothetical protein WKF85_11940 [Chitinophagaceae bacterium]
MKYILLILLFFSSSTFAQNRKFQKVVKACIDLNSDSFNSNDYISDTLVPFLKYHYFDLNDLKIAANNYKHEFKKELYTNKGYKFLSKQISDTSNSIINNKELNSITTSYKRYFRFIKPIFFPHKKKVIISYWKVNCPRCSWGKSLLLEKKKGKWDVMYELGSWIE